MKKKPKQDMYKKTSIGNILIIIISLVAFLALVLVVKYYNDRSRNDQKQIAETGSIYQGISAEGSLDEMLKFLTINEVNQAGWIELYNSDKNSGIELSKCYITVNGVLKFTFPEKYVIKAGSFSCIDGLGRLGITDNDIIGIFDENGNNLKSIMLPSLESEESYGCRTDGDISYCCLTASKEKTNSGSNIIEKSELTFSVPGGFYDESFPLEITAAKGMKIYYTLDGTEPTNQSELYKEPILINNKSGSNMHYATAEGINYINNYLPTSISMGMVVRAIAVDRNGISSKIKSQSYFIGLKYASDIKNLPVLSIITAPENLFDYFNGIYVSGRSHEDALARGEDGNSSANFLNGWMKEINVEYFEPQKDKTYEGSMTISIINDVCVMTPQKSLLLTAEGGAFAGSSLINYYNDISNRLLVLTNRKDNNYKVREYLAAKLLAGTTVGTPDLMPCIVFINGEYWGGYMLKAEYDVKYVEKRYGVKAEDILIAENGLITNNRKYQQKYDEMYNYVVTKDLSVDENYAWVKNHLDIQNYLEYICANMYLANAEYGVDKLFMWRTINDQGTAYEDGKWRFMLPRFDNTMKNGDAGNIATSSINTFLQSGLSKDKFFRSLLSNDEFQNQLGVVMTYMADDIFSEEKVNSSISNVSLQLKKMILMSYKRFVGNQGDTFYTRELDKIQGFFQQRGKYILQYTEEVKSWGGISNDGDDAISE